MFHYLIFIFSILCTSMLMADTANQPPVKMPVNISVNIPVNIKAAIERQLRSLDPNIPIENH